MIRAGIVGSTGLVGEGLIRILAAHPQVDLTILTSRHAAGSNVADVLPSLAGMVEHELVLPSIEVLAENCDVVFLAMKSAESMALVPALAKRGVKCIDIGGEFRFRDASVYTKWYGTEHEAAEETKRAVWGLPEQNRAQIGSADLVGNPGCYPTGATLGILPFMRAGLVSADGIIIGAMSGVSGAGRTYSPNSDNLFLSCNENTRAYAIGTHKHTPEIEQALSQEAGRAVVITFIPHLAPFDRGILSTIYLKPSGKLTQEAAQSALDAFAADEPFVRSRASAGAINVANVRGTNFCDVGVKFVERSSLLVVTTAIDNTVKGAGGQAVQNMNIMFGVDERTGLDRPGM